jgi:hypothetical protein
MLAAEATAASLIRDLRAAGIEPLLLKGPSLERWLYRTDERRVSGDIDLLVAPDQLPHAERALKTRGFANRYDGVSPPWAEEHADAWRSVSSAFPVDLHRRLWGFDAPPEMVWARLWGDRATMQIGGIRVDVLGEPARALAVALHAAHHGESKGKPIADLARAVARLSEATWGSAAEVARELGAETACVAGLSLVDGGLGLAERVGLPRAARTSISVTPRMWSVPETAEGFVRLAEAPGLLAKLGLVYRELVPSREFMQTRSPEAFVARRGRGGLAAAYLARWGRLLVETPAGIRAARRLRRS